MIASPRGAVAVSCSITVLLAIVGTPASSRIPQQNASGAAPAIERGQKQFVESCGFCHGADATGARGPDLVRSPLVAHDVKGDQIGEVILHGRPDKGMPPQSLTEQQISDIAAYLHARAAESIKSSGVPSAYPIEKLLTGNLEAGKAYFNRAGRCNECHSPTGDLAGVARKYSSIELESRMLYPDDAPKKCVVTLANGEQVGGTVKHIDEFTIVMKDSSSGWYRTFSRDQVKVDVQDPLAAHRELMEKISPNDFHNLFAYIASLK